MARIAPATAKPAPTRNAWSNPLVRATEALWTPEWKRLWVRLLAIVVRIASPTAPPICWEVLIRPDAGPASCGDRGDRHGHEREPEGRQQRRAEHVSGERAAGARHWENHSRPPATSSSPAISVGLNPIRVTSWDASPAEMMIPTASGRYVIPVLIGE